MLEGRKKLLKELFSTPQELHSFIIGAYSGLTEWHGIESKHMKNPDVQEEKGYVYGGYIIGTILRWAIILTVGYAFFSI